MNEKLCSECGTVIPEGSENCPNCGNPVTDSPVTPEPATPDEIRTPTFWVG